MRILGSLSASKLNHTNNKLPLWNQNNIGGPQIKLIDDLQIVELESLVVHTCTYMP